MKLVIFLLVLLFPIQLHAAESSIDCLTKNIYFEAKNQSTAGQLAVALVVMNRVKDKRFPNTVCGVIYEGPTYESWKTRQFPNLPKEWNKKTRIFNSMSKVDVKPLSKKELAITQGKQKAT